ncbi:unnamed protein product [Strongylus vulgaris]|uniref:Gem-associated protein 2 n=1 Tax=Strongylus vulgaris TaxID=40348 RepID=A0A3P7J3N5_STRVU|nr:unnamed protein product [Strongylus vulgaris]
MDRGQFIDIGEFDVDAVDMDCAPQSAEQYLQQVIADRVRGPSCVSIAKPILSDLVSEKEAPPSTSAPERDPRAPCRDWRIAKVAAFSALRSRMETAPRKKAMKLQWPNLANSEEWEQLLLRRCHPKCVHFLPNFPNHQGTPPAVPVVENVIQYAVEWAECDGLSRPLREWLFALLLLVHKPVLPDVCAAMRGLANLCRRMRSSLDMER